MNRNTLNRWLPFILQVLAFVWYGAHIASQTAQNTKDIAELRMIVVPRPEYEATKVALSKQLDGMDSKIDILLTRQAK